MATSDDLVTLIGDVERALREHLSETLAPEGCSVNEWLAIRALGETSGLTMSELAERLRLQAPAATKIIDRLVTNNIAYRSLDRSDRRRVRLRLSPRGRSVHATLASVIACSDDDRINDVNPGHLIESLTTLLLTLNHPAPSVRRTVP